MTTPTERRAPSTTRLILAQAAFDQRLLLRNGEQFLLTILIPTGLLIGLTLVTALPLSVAPGASRVEMALAGVLAVAVLSSAFASLAIGVGFDRRSGALLLLATTPLSRTSILIARSIATFATVLLQTVVLAVTALALGWRPDSAALIALPILALGTLALGSLGFALAGALRAEATLAVANAAFLLLLVAGGPPGPPHHCPDLSRRSSRCSRVQPSAMLSAQSWPWGQPTCSSAWSCSSPGPSSAPSWPSAPFAGPDLPA